MAERIGKLKQDELEIFDTMSVAPQIETIAKFLHFYEAALEVCDPARLTLFALPGKLTLASLDIDQLTSTAARWSREEFQVYFHVHLHALPEGRGPYRGSNASARVAIAVWLDIDARGPGRSKLPEVLCPTVSDALQLVEEFNSRFAPLRVSLVIRSGYGIYVALRFRESYVISCQQDRQVMEALGRRFHRAFHMLACEHGWRGAVEYCDLSKVLRLPGTLNFKDAAHPQPVAICAEDPATFTLLDLDELLPLLETKAHIVTSHTGDARNIDAHPMAEVVLDPNANPPDHKFAGLAEFDPKFLRTWKHQRRLKDESQSGYDLALAYLAALADWTDQEIVDLLIANRRLHGGQPKLRRDYFERTLGKARAAQANLDSKGSPAEEESRSSAVPDSDADLGDERTATSDENVTDDAQGYPRTAGPATNDGTEKPPGTGTVSHRERGATVSATLEALSRSLGLRIRRVVKYRGDPASSYKIETDNGDVTLDRINDLTGQSRLRNRIADVTGRLIPLFEPEDWHPIVQMLLDAHDLDDLGADATQHGITGGWIREYLREKRVNDAPQDADSAREPFVKDETVCIYLENLRSWLQLRHGQKIEPRRLATYLRQYGAFHIPKLDVEINGKKTSRGVWKLPAGTWPSD
jgi:hypothetical protein